MPNSNPVSSVDESLLQALNHYGPVTALKFAKDLLIVGYGPILKVYKIDENHNITLLFNKQAFKRNKIHSIAVLGTQIAIAGGRSFAVLDTSTGSMVHEKAINEWIIACEFLSGTELLLLTSHNEILQVKLGLEDFELLQKVHCDEKSILYSGSIRITKEGKVYIAAGTVMSGVMVWDFHLKKILQTLTEHEGSIFGVKIDPTATYIISCSDDRSVKLYSVKSGNLLANGWGHGSRIWSLEFTTVSDNGVGIFSTGEDCTARLWEYKAGSDRLTQTELWDHCHLGKHVWSGDADSKFLKALVTGGADGKIRLHDISETRNSMKAFTTSNIAESSMIPFEKKEGIKQFYELSEINLLVIMTSIGRIFVLDQDNDTWEQISVQNTDATLLKEFALLRGFSSINVVTICIRNGDVLVLSFDKISHQCKMEWIRDEGEPKKVINVLTDEDSKKGEFYLFSDCPNPSTPFDLKVFTWKSDTFALQRSVQLFKPDPRIFTPTTIHFDKHNLWLLVGSRHSNFAVYDLKHEHSELPQLVGKLSPGDTVTSISTVESVNNKLIALFTIRDGLYLYVEIQLEHHKLVHNVILHNKLSKGFIEGGFVQDNDLFIYGFRSSAFYLWNETKQIEIASEVCGGAHRQWDLIRYSGRAKDYKFIYLSKSGMVVKAMNCRFKDSNYGLLVGGTHGREIRDVAVSPICEIDGSRLLATASEDATIKLGNLSNTGEVSYQWTMNNHISGLQRVAFLNENYMASTAANEELLVWRLTRVNNSVVTITEDARIEPTDENPDLRIMDFDSRETDTGFWIAAVYSNSRIKIFFYEKASKKFTLVAEDSYSNVCILNVEFLHYSGSTYLMIGTTEGILTIWNVTDTLALGTVSTLDNLVIKQQLHQSAIKAVLPIYVESSWFILTGGDDNALICSKLTPTKSGLVLEIESFVENAASATITSISPVSDGRILVTSVDQILRLWKYTGQTLVCESATYTTVADTGCSTTAEFNGASFGIVAGAGLSVWTWN